MTARCDAPPPLVSVVIVNYNGNGMVLRAIESVMRQTIADRIEVLVVDNASTDGSGEEIARRYCASVRLIRSSENRGFAGGNNLALPHARGKYLLLLNDDAIAEPAWAQELVYTAEAEAGVGMCTARILCERDPGLLDNAGILIYADGLTFSRGYMQKASGRFVHAEEALAASGCAGLYLREPVLSLGGFDEDFFAYGDDADLALRLRLMGHRCLYVPTAVVRHRQSASTGTFSLQKVYWIERNRIWVLLKLFPANWILMSPWRTLRRLWAGWRFGNRGEGVAGELLRRYSPISIIWVLLQAWFSALGGAVKMLRKRRQFLRRRVLSDDEWKALLRRFAASLEEVSFGPQA